jgi:CBS domain-containing protein
MAVIRDVLEVKGYQIHSTTPAASIDDAVIEMCRVKVGALLVVDGGRPIGMLSERDLLVRVLLAHLDPASTRVAAAMTCKLVSVDIDRSVRDAMAVMTQRRCRHLPVVEGGEIVGIVSIGDLVRTVSQEHENELRTLHEYVEGRYPG